MKVPSARISHLLVALVLLAVLYSPAPAGETIIFSLFARGWEPFEMIEDGIPVGAGPDILAAVLPEDCTLKIRPDPAPRSLLYPTDGTMHVRLEAEEWLNPNHAFLLSIPVLPSRTVLYSPADAPVEYDGPKTVEGMTIGCIKGYKYPALEQLFATGRATRYDVNSVQILLRMVKNGRINCAVLDGSNGKWLIRSMKNLHPDDFHVASRPICEVALRFVFNNIPGWQKRIESINRRIEACRKDGTIRKILSKYE